MPPLELPRRATLRELFAQRHDTFDSHTLATRMTLFMLMSHRYVRIEDVVCINIFPFTFFYIVAFACVHYDDHALRIRSNIRFVAQTFLLSFLEEFHHMYNQYSAEGLLDFAILKTCGFVMNMCKYIQEHRISRWYTNITVKLLGHFIGGERFRRDSNFAGFEEEAGNFLSNVDLPRLLEIVVGDQSREPHETYSTFNSFDQMLRLSSHISSPMHFYP